VVAFKRYLNDNWWEIASAQPSSTTHDINDRFQQNLAVVLT
jgi:hypothetical protein